MVRDREKRNKGQMGYGNGITLSLYSAFGQKAGKCHAAG